MKKLLTLLLAGVMCMSMTSCGNQQTSDGSDLEYVKNKGELVIGITLFAPMDYEDENGDLIGFDKELGDAVCEKIGVTPKFTEIN